MGLSIVLRGFIGEDARVPAKQMILREDDIVHYGYFRSGIRVAVGSIGERRHSAANDCRAGNKPKRLFIPCFAVCHGDASHRTNVGFPAQLDRAVLHEDIDLFNR